MYIGGSIANNSFNQETSDIDCYIITTAILPDNLIRQIEAMHKEFYLSNIPYAKRIEISYIPQHDLLNFDPNNIRPYFNEGRFYQAHYGNNFLIELFVLRENGISIAGPDIRELIKEISTQDLQQAIKNNLYEYWEIVLSDFSKLGRSDYQTFAILTMCRTLYSLKTGCVASKIEAARWTISHYPNWKDLIKHVLIWKHNAELSRLEETQRFIRFVLDISRSDRP